MHVFCALGAFRLQVYVLSFAAASRLSHESCANAHPAFQPHVLKPAVPGTTLYLQNML